MNVESFSGRSIVSSKGSTIIAGLGIILALYGGWETNINAPSERNKIVQTTPECSGLDLTYPQLEELQAKIAKPGLKPIDECYASVSRQVDSMGLGQRGWRTVVGHFVQIAGGSMIAGGLAILRVVS